MDTEVRRSDRLKIKSDGFKPSACARGNYVACHSEPPVLTPKMIKNLGTEFCKMAPKELSEEALGKKRKSAAPIGKGTHKEAAKKQSKEEGNPKTSTKKPAQDPNDKKNNKKSKK